MSQRHAQPNTVARQLAANPATPPRHWATGGTGVMDAFFAPRDGENLG